MEMPDEKQSGIYGIQANKNDFDDDVVESLALDDSVRRPSNKPVVQQKQLGPGLMKQKIKESVAEGSGIGKRPSSQVQKTTTP